MGKRSSVAWLRRCGGSGGQLRVNGDVVNGDVAKPRREFPRLCRGGSGSLTFTGVAVGVEVVRA